MELSLVLLNFNTSHVNVNLLLKTLLNCILLYFNTSHVNVNLQSRSPLCNSHCISIHLMLMLIIFSATPFTVLVLHFNTSHVNVNLYSHHIQGCRPCNFNTSHVNVNLASGLSNILCACISIHLMLMLIHAKVPYKNPTELFQYISC